MRGQRVELGGHSMFDAPGSGRQCEWLGLLDLVQGAAVMQAPTGFPADINHSG